MRYLLLIFILISGVTLADQPKNDVNREMYERIIEKQFPGFRIMREEDFVEMYKGQFRDGKSGSLLYGHFDSDENLDFAAYLIGAKRKYQADDKTSSPSDNIYDGLIAICHGDKQGNFACEKMVDAAHWGREGSEIVLVPRGTFDCMKGEGKSNHITTQFDSIGRYSESGGAFYVRQSDATYKKCVTSD